MDGEIQFFSFNKPSDWLKGQPYNLEISERGLWIRQTEKYAVQRVVHLDELDGVGEICDFAIGQFGKTFLLDEHANVWIYATDNDHLELLFRSGHGLFGKQAIVSCAGETLLFADPGGSRRLAAYSVSNAQSIWTVDEWDGRALYPLAIATSAEKIMYVIIPLEVVEGTDGNPTVPENGAIGLLKMNLSGEVLALYTNDKLTIKQQTGLDVLRHRIFAAVAANGDIFVFDTGSNALFTFSAEGELLSRMLMPSFQFSGLAVDSRNNVYIGDSRTIAEEGEDDRFILNFGATGELIAKVAGYRGKTDKLLLDGRNKMFILNRENATLTLVALLPRTMEMDLSGRMEGVFISSSVDSTVTETVWHKIVLEADIPEETQIRVSYFGSDRMEHMVDGVFTNLDDYIVSADISAYEKLRGLQPFWSQALINPKDALFFEAKGRFLWMKIELFGSEQKTPLLQKIRAYYPRQSYLSYLPAVYQESNEGNHFLERYLSLYGTLYNEIEDKIGHISRYLDTDAVSGPYLRWLGRWLGIDVDDNWNDEQRRNLIQSAPELYRQRGTRQGIEKWVEIFTGEKPFIVEYFQLQRMRDIAEWKELADQLYGMGPYTFTVMVKPEFIDTEKKRLILQTLLDEQKPAFTEARLVALQPWMYMDMHSYMGINTFLSEPSLLTLDPSLSMPNNTLIVDFERDRRLDIHTRLEIDSEME